MSGSFAPPQIQTFRHGFLAQDGVAPFANATFATFDTKAISFDASEVVLDFDAATNESTIFLSREAVRNYNGGGLIVTMLCCMTAANSGNVVMQAAIRRSRAGDSDVQTFAASQSSAATAVPATAQVYFTVTVTLTNGAQIDSLANGDRFYVLITRNAVSASDTATGDLELVSVEVKETGT